MLEDDDEIWVRWFVGSVVFWLSIELKLLFVFFKKEDDNILSDMDCDDVEEWKLCGVWFLKMRFLCELVLLSVIKKNVNNVLIY